MAAPFGSSPYAPRELYDYSSGPGSRISELILAAGDARARAQQQQAQLLGGMVSSLGQQAGEAIQAHQEQRQAEHRSRLQDAALQSGDPRQIVHAFGAKDGADIIKALGTLHPEGQKSYKDRMELARDTARGIKALPEDKRPAGYAFARTQLIGGKVFADNEVPTDYEPGFIDQLASYGAEAPKPIEVSPGAGIYDPTTHQTTIPVPAAEKVDTRSLDARYAEAVASGDQAAAQQLLQAKARLEAAGRVPESESAPTLTPAALDMAALRYRIDGTLPPMGMGKAGATVRQAIINRAAEVDPTANIAANKALYGADKASLQKLQQQTDAVTAFENTADRNAQVLRDIAKDIPDFGAKFLNKTVRAAAGRLGSKNMAKFDSIRQSVQNEYARILSNPNLAGTMSDSARKEAETLLSPDATVGQIAAALDTLKLEASNRRQEYQGQLDVVKGRLGGKAEKPKRSFQVGKFQVEVED